MPTHMETVLGAAAFAAEKHRTQRRKDIDTPFINHPIQLAYILVQAYRDSMGSVRAKHPNARLQGVLVQEMLSGGVETIVGVANRPPTRNPFRPPVRSPFIP